MDEFLDPKDPWHEFTAKELNNVYNFHHYKSKAFVFQSGSIKRYYLSQELNEVRPGFNKMVSHAEYQHFVVVHCRKVELFTKDYPSYWNF